MPTTPVVIAATGNAFGLNSVALERNFAIAADFYFPNSVPLFEVGSSPPSYAGALNFYVAPRYRDDNGMGIDVRDGLIYMVGDRTNVYRFGLVGSSDLFIGRYADFSEAVSEAEPPVVELTAPVDGDSVRERTYLTLTATATDNIAVTRLHFLVDGATVATLYSAPYRAYYRVPTGASQLVVTADASDLAGNQTATEPATVAVVPDNRPTVKLLAPVDGARAVEGTPVVLAADATDDVAVARVDFRVGGLLQASTFFPPYRATVYAPYGETAMTVTAVATDSSGQTATSDPVVVAIDPDRPPTATILAPADGTEVVEGGAVRVVVGAEDDFAVYSVRFVVDGVDATEDFSPPYEHDFAVPSGGTEMRLSAVAFDVLGQEGMAPEVTLTIVPDPGTTASGRIVDVDRAPVAGADVVCGTVAGTSAGDGTFSLDGVPTALGRVSCTATAVGAGGEPLTGASAAVPPDPGGVTELGDVLVAPLLLYAGGGDLLSPSPGRLLVFDAAAASFVPWSDPFEPGGLTGLAFDQLGALFATTFQETGGAVLRYGSPSGGQQSVAQPATFFSPESTLLRLDVDSGETLELVGEVTETNDGVPVGVLDLAPDSFTGGLLAYGYDYSAGDGLYRIDSVTAGATRLASGFSYDTAAIAVGRDGLLYLFGTEGFGAEFRARATGPQTSVSGQLGAAGPTVLVAFNPADGTLLSTQPVPGWTGDSIDGMTLQAGSGVLLVASGNNLFTLDPATLAVAPFASPAPPPEGHLQSLASRPLFAPPVLTDVTGEVIDADNAPLSDAVVSTVGGAGASDPDGRFTLFGVAVRTRLVRVAADFAGTFQLSPAVPPVAGGTTDVGTLQFGSYTCVTGTVSALTCQVDPLVSTLSLYALDPFGNELPVGPVTPDAFGAFCVTVRRDQLYLLRKEGLDCCGQPATCETTIVGSDPGSTGRCGEPDVVCEDLGQVDLWCDFFCGS